MKYEKVNNNDNYDIVMHVSMLFEFFVGLC